MSQSKNINLLYAIALLQGMVFYGPIATLYRQAQGLSVFHITIIESISLLLMLLLEIPWGMIADKIGYKKTIILCNILYFLSKIVFWKATGFLMFLLERIILAIVCAGLSGCDSAFLYLSTTESDSRKVFGRYEAMNTAGLLFASILFSVWIKTSYSLAALLTVFSYGIAMVLSLFLEEVKPYERISLENSISLKENFIVIARDKRIFLFLIAAALLAESNQTITVFLSQIQYIKSGIKPESMGYLYSLMTIVGLAAVFSDKMVNWLGEHTTSRLLFVMGGFSCLSLAIFQNSILSILSIGALRLSASLFVPIRISVENTQVSTSNRATILSIYSICMNTIAILTNLLFGKLADIEIRLAMLLGAVSCFVGLLLYRWWE